MKFIRPPFHTTAAINAVRAATENIGQLAAPLVNAGPQLNAYRFRPVKSVIEINAGGNYPAVQPPDGNGRFNHFKNGSIYWTPKTGPAAVWGKLRDCWAASGWERGPLGYPIQNQHRMIPIPASDPIVEWCRF